MPTRISAGVQVITLISLLFIYLTPIDSKITNFSLSLLVCFFSTSSYHFKRKNDYQLIFLCIPPIIKQRKIHQTVRFIFTCSSYSVTIDNSMKSISAINLAIMKNTECSIVKAHATNINQQWVCQLIMVNHYASFPATLSTFGNISSKEQCKKNPVNSALTKYQT